MYLKDSKTVVVKIGSSLLIDKDQKIRVKWLSEFAKDIKNLKNLKKNIIIVSSGAIALGCKKLKLSKFRSAKNNGVINAINEIPYPSNPRIAIFLLPYLSLVLPQNALVVAHAKADIAKIEEVCISLKPKSLARGGTRTKTND